MTGRSTPPRARGWSLYAVTTVLALSACTTGGQVTSSTSTATIALTHSGTRTSSGSSTTPAEGTPSSPTTSAPAVTQADSPDGAVEFARYVVALVNRAYQVPDPRLLDGVFAPQCTGCTPLRNDVAEVEALRQRAVADFWSVRSASPLKWQPGSAEIDLSISQARVDLVDKQGARVDNIGAAEFRYLLTLRFDKGWRVEQWSKLEIR